MKVGIIGCGNVASSHLKGYRANGLDVCALTDIDREKALAFSEKAEGAELFEDFRALIDSGKVEAVSICSPPVAHEEAVLYALSKGIHVLLEKPQAHSVESAGRIRNAAKESDAILMMAFRHRFLPAIIKIKEMLDAGSIGKTVFFHNTFCGPAFAMKDRWFTKKAVSGGGCILDTGSHSVDLFRFLIGEVVEQNAVMHTNFEGTDVEDAGIIIVKAEDGTLGSMTSAFVAGSPMAFIDIMGQGGRLLYEYSNPTELKHKKTGEKDWRIIPVEQGLGFDAQIGHFIAAVEGREKLSCTAEDGFRCMQIIQAS